MKDVAFVVLTVGFIFFIIRMVEKKFKSNVGAVQSIEGKYKMVPMEWYWKHFQQDEDGYWSEVDKIRKEET